MDEELRERIVVLEQQCEKIAEIEHKQDEIIKQLYIYKGVWGVVLMVLGALGIGLKIGLEWFLSKSL